MKAQSSAMTIVLVFAIFFGMAFQCDSNEDGGVTDNSGRQPSNKAALDEVGDINLPPLAAKPGYIVGRAFLADGRPIPSFKVGAVGYDGKAHVMNTGVPSLGEVEGRNGRYSLQTTYAYDRSEPVSATVIGVSATTKVNYSGEEFTIFLHPVAGKKNGSDQDGFRGDSGKGVVRDFVMKISGRKPGSEGLEEKYAKFYGAHVKLDLTMGDGRTYGSDLSSTAPKGSTITVTFKPDAELLDGTAGETVTRIVKITSGSDFYFDLNDIPIGNYTATAQMTQPDGTVRELKLSSKREDFRTSAAVEMKPEMSVLGGGKGSTLFLVK